MPNFRRLGPKVGKLMPQVKQRLAGGRRRRRPSTRWRRDGAFELEVDGTTIRLEPDDVEVRATSHEEFALAEDGGVAVALDTRVDRELALEGLAREVIRVLNDRRKANGLEISDRIRAFGCRADGDARARRSRAHRDWIAGEVLARGAAPGVRAARSRPRATSRSRSAR